MDANPSDLTALLQVLFTTDAEEAAQQSALILRKRQITGPAFAQGLVFGWMQHPDATLPQLAASLARAGVRISSQALDDRFDAKASAFFRLLLDKAFRRLLAPPLRVFGLLARFNGVHLIDATSIALPAALAADWPSCGGDPACPGTKAGLKALVRFEVASGAITGLSLHPGKVSDSKAAETLGPLPRGALRVADLAFAGLDALAACSAAGVRYLTRIKATSVIYGSKGRKEKLARYLARQKADRLDREVWLGEGKRLKGRLLALRAPQGVAAKRRKDALESARDHGGEARPETLSLCGWTVFFTDVPREQLSLQEAWVIYRVRWQVELLFKGWKSDGLLDESRSAKPQRVLCEVLAKLLGALVQDWLLLASGGAAMGPRSRRQAAQVVRGQVGHVAAVFLNGAALALALATMGVMVAAVPDVRKRNGRPAAFQTLLDPFKDGLSEEAGQDPRAVPSYEDDEDDGAESEPTPASPRQEAAPHA